MGWGESDELRLRMVGLQTTKLGADGGCGSDVRQHVGRHIGVDAYVCKCRHMNTNS